MFGRETRMLLRHYLEHGTTKSALARRLGVSRDTIHRWIRDGDLDRDLDDTAVRYGPRRPMPTKLDRYRASCSMASWAVSLEAFPLGAFGQQLRLAYFGESDHAFTTQPARRGCRHSSSSGPTPRDSPMRRTHTDAGTSRLVPLNCLPQEAQARKAAA